LKNFFGFLGSNQRVIDKLKPLVDKINSLESDFEKLSDAELKGKTQEFKERLAKGETLDDLLPEAFAVVREAAKREIEQRHFDVQLIGGIVLHQGKIAEMKTGEGKTLVATLPLYLNALEGKGVHLVTVNDYLAKFQGEWMGRIYHRLGFSTGIIQNQGVSFIFDPQSAKEDAGEPDEERKTLAAEVYENNLRPCSRKQAYDADITYGTNNEFGFDYLRDNMAQDISQVSQRSLRYVIVDEVDSILIDEARTPLIISAAAEESTQLYARFAALVPNLKVQEDYEVDEKMRAVTLTDKGMKRIEKMLNLDNIYETGSITLVHHLEQALKANILFKRDKDYIVRDGEVIIIDEFTGRMMPGRRYSEGLHQAIEAKESVEIKRESETLATISFQNLFRLYDKLSGMTGTAATEAEEFYKIYKLEVVEIPTDQEMIRVDKNDLIYKTEEAKFNAAIDKVRELNENNQPVLIGTISIEKSEIVSKLLRRDGIKHQVLNAKHHEKEARIIAQAGRPGAVTVATNMAGRGVDIILGGTLPKPGEAEKVIKAGGLYVLGTERHEARRIDNQLRGRSGRQGDPGESQFFVSMEDDLMRIFGGERLKSIMDRMGFPEDQPIQHKLISRSIEQAQRRVEGHNFDLRKHLVEYDDVLNKQREIIYKKRRRILELDPRSDNSLRDEILSKMIGEEKSNYESKTEKIDKVAIRDIERRVYMSVVDQFWVQHLTTMDDLRDSIGLRGYAQVDPLVAYKQESFTLFDRLIHSIDDKAIDILNKAEFSIVPSPAMPPPKQEGNLVLQGPSEELSGGGFEETVSSKGTVTTKAPEESIIENTESNRVAEGPERSRKISKSGVTTSVRTVSDRMNQVVSSGSREQSQTRKVGRNDPCPCGAKKPDGRPVKYKHCCGR